MQWIIFAETASNVEIGTVIQSLAGIGQAASALIMAFLFIKANAERDAGHIAYNTERDKKQELRDDRIFLMFAELAKDRGQIIRDNTAALTKVETSVDRLIDVVQKVQE